MIGALIGDLAAWTYEHDKKMFFKQLVADNGGNAQLSIYGKALLNAASHNLIVCPWIRTEPVPSDNNRDEIVGQWLMWQIVSAWTDKNELNSMPDFNMLEKEELYAKRFILDLIRSLRNGATKSEAYYSTVSFEDLSKTWNWKTDNKEKNIGLLTYIFRAWDSFIGALISHRPFTML